MKHFSVEEHTIPAQHIREYPNATSHSQEDVLQIAIKHYAPLEQSLDHDKPLVTIIATHANGFPKEMYEPLWDDLWEALSTRGISIRGIWFADSSNQGAGGVLNEHVQGDDRTSRHHHPLYTA